MILTPVSAPSCGVGRLSLRAFPFLDRVFDTDLYLQPILLIWFNSESILLGLKQEPEVASLAATYLKWASLGLPAYAFNGISRRYFQSQGAYYYTPMFTSADLHLSRTVCRADTHHHVHCPR